MQCPRSHPIMIRFYDSITPSDGVCQRLATIAQVWRSWSSERRVYFTNSGKIAPALAEALDETTALLCARFGALWREIAPTVFVTPFSLEIVCLADQLRKTSSDSECSALESELLCKVKQYHALCAVADSIGQVSDVDRQSVAVDAVGGHLERLLDFVDDASKPMYGVVYSATNRDCVAFYDNVIGQRRWLAHDAAVDQRLWHSLEARPFRPRRSTIVSAAGAAQQSAKTHNGMTLSLSVKEQRVEPIFQLLHERPALKAKVVFNVVHSRPQQRGRVVIVRGEDDGVKHAFWQPLDAINGQSIDANVYRYMKTHDSEHFVVSTIEETTSQRNRRRKSRTNKQSHTFVFLTLALMTGQ